ncbi:enoyl-CoA hydratase/isomerase family protein [Flavobacterium myungsuense]|uniref:Enoyl-CoA hydratase/isomerase family protein n=1 Tax=Flavobacterium myungsuense TaxID=651823 RepID=A0ABW3J0W0_9FLAO
MTEAYVKQDIHNGIATIEFFHPEHNSLPTNLLTALTETITNAGTNDTVKVIVLKSVGDRTFCAGASLKELVQINDIDSGNAFFSGFANVINAMRKCPKFIIGRIQGKAVGGGVGIAAAADYCLATKHAAIKLSEFTIGIGPFVVGPAIERKMGISALSQMTINATQFFEATWAKDKGLYSDVYDTNQDLDDAVKVLAESVCLYNLEAMMEAKKIFWTGTDRWDLMLAERAAISGRLVLSDFTKETLKRFKQAKV